MRLQDRNLASWRGTILGQHRQSSLCRRSQHRRAKGIKYHDVKLVLPCISADPKPPTFTATLVDSAHRRGKGFVCAP
ncbi:hypothetical protein WJX84_005789 [Apatococcus fuscideae]|uniref:Uncharacterized protein n=1 Tax=Apatococcus fuscideae TaxID=2026836 RepID=A0AAW1SYG4_9CHLO